jgi:hypothetical protein
MRPGMAALPDDVGSGLQPTILPQRRSISGKDERYVRSVTLVPSRISGRRQPGRMPPRKWRAGRVIPGRGRSA